MAASLRSPLTSGLAVLSNSCFGKRRGHICSLKFLRSYRPFIKIRSIFLPPRFRSQSLSFSSNTAACGYTDRSLAREDLVILGIETSCDDTAAAVVKGDGEILSQVVSSQDDLLSQYGGVAPKMAEEAHSLVIDQVVQQALDDCRLTGKDLSAVAVTIGPGLSLCLRVGVSKARRMAGRFNLPLIGVHHMEAHALVARLVEKDLQFPFLALLISGGHNLLILAYDVGHYVQLGTTIDDAIGEAYDKTARWLGLDMIKGGGPALEELAREGDADSVKLKVPMRQHKDCNFSYAGLKTQVRLAIESRNICVDSNPSSSASSHDRKSRADIAASFQRVAVLHLEERCGRAIEWAREMEPSIKYLVVSGGVASNQYVRARLNHVVQKNGLCLVCPPPKLCTDNGGMADRRPRRSRREDAAQHRAEHTDTARSLEPVSHLDLLREWPVICDRFIGTLDVAGVGSLMHLSYITLDSRLLTALVERWSPTTNTFLLPVGEMTITLEDHYRNSLNNRRIYPPVLKRYPPEWRISGGKSYAGKSRAGNRIPAEYRRNCIRR